jgi:hypothetical protein
MEQRPHNWLTIPAEAKTTSGGVQPGTAIVTYAQDGEQVVLDGAILLGRSLRNVTKYPKLCLVTEDMSEANKQLLIQAKWQIVTVPVYTSQKYNTPADKFPKKLFKNVYEKVEAFRLPFEQVLYLEPETFVRKPEQLDELIATNIPSGQIGMVEASLANKENAPWIEEQWPVVNWPDGPPKEFTKYESGVMLFHPDLAKYSEIRTSMDQDAGAASLPGASINQVYKNKVVQLPDTYNVHGNHNCGIDASCATDKCGNAVVSHMTGPIKPAASYATWQKMPYKNWVKGGVTKPKGSLERGPDQSNGPQQQVMPTEEPYNECPNLRQEYFCKLEENVDFLTASKEDDIGQNRAGNLTCEDAMSIWLMETSR